MSNVEKANLLSRANFVYAFKIGCYVNNNTKKIFSVEALQENSVSWIRQRIEEKDNKWTFYFSQKISKQNGLEILKLIT